MRRANMFTQDTCDSLNNRVREVVDLMKEAYSIVKADPYADISDLEAEGKDLIAHICSVTDAILMCGDVEDLELDPVVLQSVLLDFAIGEVEDVPECPASCDIFHTDGVYFGTLNRDGQHSQDCEKCDDVSCPSHPGDKDIN